MACDVATLMSDACDNDLAQAAYSEPMFRALVLQLLYNQFGNGETLSQLLSDACDNGFLQAAANEQEYRALELQMLCVASGG